MTDKVCPNCKGPLTPVRYPGGHLNREQWKSIREGDYLCPNCPDNGRSKQGGCYWWDSEVEWWKRADERDKTTDHAKTLEENGAHIAEIILLEALGDPHALDDTETANLVTDLTDEGPWAAMGLKQPDTLEVITRFDHDWEQLNYLVRKMRAAGKTGFLALVTSYYNQPGQWIYAETRDELMEKAAKTALKKGD